jgi:hypothetical protein
MRGSCASVRRASRILGRAAAMTAEEHPLCARDFQLLGSTRNRSGQEGRAPQPAQPGYLHIVPMAGRAKLLRASISFTGEFLGRSRPVCARRALSLLTRQRSGSAVGLPSRKISCDAQSNITRSVCRRYHWPFCGWHIGAVSAPGSAPMSSNRACVETTKQTAMGPANRAVSIAIAGCLAGSRASYIPRP